MTYKITNPKKKIEFAKDSKRLIRIYQILNDEAYIIYGTDFNDLSKREQKEIAKKVMKEEYPYGI